MSQEIEIEFKNLVSKSDFHVLCKKFFIDQSAFVSQINHYFDSDDFLLKSNHSALRIREKNKQYTLTLKQPNVIGLLETHQKLTREEATSAFKGILPPGLIADQLLLSFNIDIVKLRYLGSLITNRAEIEYHGGTLVFDHSKYLDTEDFEIEYEVNEEEIGKEIFENIFRENKISIKKTDNKIKRFFLRKQQLENK
ncbi:CYTH domain-containing protein [Anaerobacillus alkaliphilus]|uniref:CYTH domain-containing protein n=1 Tax=Anaerobacillus alkaliphilus TaxID=1548597 RepID=A0A4Q0VP59_9BACI|nr:CYTH domain-containing protein [Anaerobacillus alkaliphilus]RXI98232.1 CYTH domain-containing protein [Anaerobacillus alkaliphilus]